jgi:hypothetical protein
MKRLDRIGQKGLLDTRLCDLNLKIEGTLVNTCIKGVLREIAKKGIKITPHFWVSDEWFSPDGTPGVAVPFYLLHPKLMKLEKKMMGEIEGGTKLSCTKIIRHEMGHVLDNAFKLRNLKIRQRHFGHSSKAYPDYYYPVKDTTKFVHHLEDWYAQAHPDEDWAECFAVWLSSPNWKRKFKNWDCFPKMEYLDQIMKKIAGKKPKVSNKFILDPISESTLTLREYYEKKRKRFKVKSNPHLINVLKKYKSDFYKELAAKTNQNSYNLKQIYRLILVNKEVNFSGRVTKKKVVNVLTRHGVRYFRRRIRITM